MDIRTDKDKTKQSQHRRLQPLIRSKSLRIDTRRGRIAGRLVKKQLQGQRLALKGGHIFGLEGANERMHGMCIPAGKYLQVHEANDGANNSPGA